MLQHGACASAREDTGDDAAARGKQQRNYKDREQGEHDQRPSGYVAECDRCLHAGMDIYKWTMKLGPLVPGELLLDTFDLALDIGRVDMQASPYDVSEYGLPPVKIETPRVKARMPQCSAASWSAATPCGCGCLTRSPGPARAPPHSYSVSYSSSYPSAAVSTLRLYSRYFA